MPFDWWIVGKLLAVAALVALNGFFVAAEFAIVKVRRTQLAERLRAGDRRARVADHVTTHLDAYLSATQLGITFASLGLGWLGEPAVADLLEGPLLGLGVASPAVLHTLAFTLAFATITLLHIVIGELAPKSLAIQRAEAVALSTSRPLHAFYVVFKPAIWALNGLANLLLRTVGVPPASESERAHTEEELRLLLAEAGKQRALTKPRADILLRVFQLKHLEARHAMTPRPRIEALDARAPFEESLRRAEETGYTRYPLVEGDLEHVRGMVHYRDLVRLARHAPSAAKDLAAIRRPVLIVPESKPLEDLLTEMLARGIHMAVVMDEHGSTAGLVTLEDLFEEVFGEIRDEFDVGEPESPYRVLGEHHYLLDGQMQLHQASALLDARLESPDVTTVGGYVVERLGHIPAKGERLRLGEYEARVREADRRRVQSLEVWRADGGAAGRPDEAGAARGG